MKIEVKCMRAVIWLSIFVFVMALLITEVSAYPIPPQTLRMLTNDSELIVVARVEDVTQLEKRYDKYDWYTAMARLEVISVLKGVAQNRYINVPYPANLACPAPPHYEVGETVLAFLAPSESGSDYITVGLSYGSKNLDANEIGIYSARVHELVEIEKQTDPDTCLLQLVEWLVLCAEHPATRWEGTYDLINSHRLKMVEEELGEKVVEIAPGQYAAENRLYGLEQKEKTIDFSVMLTQDQKTRLANTLYRVYSISDGVWELIVLVELWEDENLTPFIWSYLTAIKVARRGDQSWDIGRLMRTLATRLNNQEALKLVEMYESLSDWDQERESQRLEKNQAILQQFIEAIERSGAPNTIEINDKPEMAPDSSQYRRDTDSKTGLFAIIRLDEIKGLSAASLQLGSLYSIYPRIALGLATIPFVIIGLFILAATLRRHI
jgi:hypothetical protein